jgi:hypothetical protein
VNTLHKGDDDDDDDDNNNNNKNNNSVQLIKSSLFTCCVKIRTIYISNI